MQMGRGATALILVGLSSLLFSRATQAAAPSASKSARTVCTVTINSDEEKNSFRSHLPAKDFKFVELTDIGKTSSSAPNDDWFQKACKSGVQCDVLVVSGHFAGSFFGSSKLEMGLDEMERNSCRSTCDGILKNPKEAFLFGCNTLAGKEKDSRTFEEYVEIQVKDGIDRPIAVRNAQARYGAMGSSFKDRMRRVFTNVPNIYGFSSVGPLGASVKPFLDNYFKKVPNYASHIDNAQAQKKTAAAREIANQAVSMNSAVQNINNTVLADSMRNFAFSQCGGVQDGTPGAAMRREICQLYDRNTSLSQKAEAAAAMLRKPDRLSYLPSVLSFIRSNESEIDADPAARAALKALLSEKTLWAEAGAILGNPKENPFTKVDILRMSLALGKIDQPTFENAAKTILGEKLRKLDQETIDLACSLRKEHGLKLTVSSSEIDPARLSTNAGVAAFACLRTTDPKVTARVLSTFKVMSPRVNADAVQLGLQGLMALPDYEEERAVEARRYVGNANPTLDAYGRMALATVAPAEERNAMIEGLVGLPIDSQIEAYDAMAKSGEPNEGLARALTQSLKYGDNESFYGRVQVITKITPQTSTLWKELATTVDAQGPAAAASAANYLRDLPKPPTSMAFWAIQNMQSENGKKENPYRAYYTSLLAKMELSPGMISKLADQVVEYPTDSHAARLRYILRHQKNAQFTPAQQQAIDNGRVAYAECELSGSVFACNEMLAKP